MTPKKEAVKVPGPWRINPGNHSEVWGKTPIGNNQRICTVESLSSWKDAAFIAAAPETAAERDRLKEQNAKLLDFLERMAPVFQGRKAKVKEYAEYLAAVAAAKEAK